MCIELLHPNSVKRPTLKVQRTKEINSLFWKCAEHEGYVHVHVQGIHSSLPPNWVPHLTSKWHTGWTHHASKSQNNQFLHLLQHWRAHRVCWWSRGGGLVCARSQDPSSWFVSPSEYPATVLPTSPAQQLLLLPLSTAVISKKLGWISSSLLASPK